MSTSHQDSQQESSNVHLWPKWRHNEHDGISNHQPHNSLLNHLLRRWSKKTLKLCITGLCEGNSLVIGEFPTQRASNVETVSIWCRHQVDYFFVVSLKMMLKKQSSCEWSGIPWCSWDITVLSSFLPGQNDRHFTDDIFRCIFVNEKFCNFIKISLKFVPMGPIDNHPALV